MGLEPTSGGTTIHCLNLLATLAIPFLNIASEHLIDQFTFSINMELLS